MKWYDPRLGKVLALRDHATRLMDVRQRQRARGQHAKAAATGRALAEARHRLFDYAHERRGRRWYPGFSPVQRTAYRALLDVHGQHGFTIRGYYHNPWWD